MDLTYREGDESRYVETFSLRSTPPFILYLQKCCHSFQPPQVWYLVPFRWHILLISTPSLSNSFRSLRPLSIMYTQSSCWVVLFSLTLSTFVLPVASQNAVPPTTKDPKTFSNGAPFLGGEPVCNDAFSVPNVYGAREVDLPFNRLYHGNMKFFSPGQLNTPTGPTDVFGSQNDDAQQSACGIPDNAFFISKVAIHPYFLKYADLSRKSPFPRRSRSSHLTVWDRQAIACKMFVFRSGRRTVVRI